MHEDTYADMPPFTTQSGQFNLYFFCLRHLNNSIGKGRIKEKRMTAVMDLFIYRTYNFRNAEGPVVEKTYLQYIVAKSQH